MELKHLHSLILTTRKQLARLYESLGYAKVMRKWCVEEGEQEDEYFWHNEVNALKKKILKLATLQIAMKQEVQGQLWLDRTIRSMQRAIPECEPE